ncbi:suppressor of cytokine signaling 6 [Topomyia yanbarensis]|uniref:suppressor of cytokine signaling 6 n=1 Tax=Topomyia yanbarensis TaxID=2498891 RepID=UPI00273C1F29|nr:suppressor of cytokine signaling 6 [Topomyia yanbarensis]
MRNSRNRLICSNFGAAPLHILHKTQMTNKTFKSTGSIHKNEIFLERRRTSSLQSLDLQKNLSEKKVPATNAEYEYEQKRSTISTEECKKNIFSINIKQKLCNIFRINKRQQYLRTKKSLGDCRTATNGCNTKFRSIDDYYKKWSASTRKLPPLPKSVGKSVTNRVSQHGIIHTIIPAKQNKKACVMEFTASIDKVKDCGWYWGPISSEGAEKILSNETDGSFLVRDSSDDHYIFSLTFKLNGSVRHVRIDQDQGTFSFGSCAKFKSRTIMEFIENAVEHSRSGRYLFFLHRRPEHGPLRVQLTKPVSRFKHVQSLQHLCRFIIHRTIIRKDLIQTLPLPRRVLDYLNYKNCLLERIERDMV